MLYGLALGLDLNYYNRFPRDRWAFKLLVAAMILLDGLATTITMADYYHRLIDEVSLSLSSHHCWLTPQCISSVTSLLS